MNISLVENAGPGFGDAALASTKTSSDFLTRACGYSRQWMQTLASELRISPFKSVREGCLTLDSRNAHLETIRGELPAPMTVKEAMEEIKHISKKDRGEAERVFSTMVGNIRERTSYFSHLEASGIPDAMERGDVLKHRYSTLVFARHGAKVEKGTEVLEDFYLANGGYGATSGFIFMTLHGRKEITKDSLMMCWSHLAAEGSLPSYVGVLAHELHHHDQATRYPFWRILDILPPLRLSILNWLHCDPGACEITAHVLDMLSPSESPRHNESLSTIHRSLSHPEFSTYTMGDALPFEMSCCVLNLFLLGMDAKEMASLVASTRFKNTDEALRFFQEKESTLRVAQGLEDDVEYQQTLALRYALHLTDNEIKRCEVIKISRDALASLPGQGQEQSPLGAKYY